MISAAATPPRRPHIAAPATTPDNAFGAFLGILVGADAVLVPGRGQRWTDAGVVSGAKRTAAWRICDAQFWGVPQRRRRVFVVACRGAGNFACAEALFPLRTSVQRDTAPRRETREDTAAGAGDGTAAGCIPLKEPQGKDGKGCLRNGTHGEPGDPMFTLTHTIHGVAIANPLGAKTSGGWRGDLDNDTFVAFDVPGTGPGVRSGGVPVMTLAIRGRGDSHDLEYRDDGIANAVLTPNGGRGGIGVGAVAFHENQRAETYLSDVMHSLKCGGGKPGQGYPAIAIPLLEIGKRTNGDGYRDGDGIGRNGDPMYSLQAGAQHGIGQAMSVRRLTPRECARLQGFPDNWCAIEYRGKPAADGPMYRAYGNSMAVPVIGWVLSRVQQIAAASLEEAA